MAKGLDIIELAKKHIGEKYVLGCSVPKDHKDWKGPWDCSEFTSWCVYQVSEVLYGCSNRTNPKTANAYTGFWAKDVKKLGTSISIQEAIETPGAALLRKPNKSGKGGHIAFSDGQGKTVEAHSASRGVCRSTPYKRRWDTGILVPEVTYQRGEVRKVYVEPAIVYRWTHPMMKGSKVKEIQRKLKALGFDPGPIDGEYGSKTYAAVMAFQIKRRINVDGEVGSQTAKSLRIAL